MNNKQTQAHWKLQEARVDIALLESYRQEVQNILAFFDRELEKAHARRSRAEAANLQAQKSRWELWKERFVSNMKGLG